MEMKQFLSIMGGCEEAAIPCPNCQGQSYHLEEEVGLSDQRLELAPFFPFAPTIHLECNIFGTNLSLLQQRETKWHPGKNMDLWGRVSHLHFNPCPATAPSDVRGGQGTAQMGILEEVGGSVRVKWFRAQDQKPTCMSCNGLWSW